MTERKAKTARPINEPLLRMSNDHTVLLQLVMNNPQDKAPERGLFFVPKKFRSGPDVNGARECVSGTRAAREPHASISLLESLHLQGAGDFDDLYAYKSASLRDTRSACST
jgi:hypothetical protein